MLKMVASDLKRVHPNNKEDSHIHVTLYATVVLRTMSGIRFWKAKKGKNCAVVQQTVFC